MTIEEFKGMQAIEFTLPSLSILMGPGAYVYCVGDTAIYVGSSKKVANRMFARNHDKREEFKRATSVLILPCETWADAEELESELTATLQPELNIRNMRVPRAKSLAKLLGNGLQATASMYIK